MAAQGQRAQVFTRRVALIAGGQLALFGVLLGRLYQLQVLQRDRYQTLAEDNRVAMRLLAPSRGRILDRYGVPLALNRQNYRLVITAEQSGGVTQALDALAAIVTISDNDRRRVMREVARRRRFVPVTVREELSWDEVSRVAVNAPDLPGVAIDVGTSREYPYATEFAHVLGYVAPPSETDLTGDTLLELPEMRIGRNGVERVYDVALRGRAGTSQLEVNAVGRPIRELTRLEGDPGLDVVLTIDLELQRVAAQALAEQQSGAAVLIDVLNGDVLALASTPAYNPGDFERGIPATTWNQLNTDARHPLLNKAVAGIYNPGSTFKPMVALAALEAGISPEMGVACPGHRQFGDHTFYCWKRGGHGGVAMVDAIAQSCDCYFYEVALRVGIDKIGQMARRFGLGETQALDLPGERSGLIPTREWKLQARGERWLDSETLICGIGQGYILATPLQLAVMCARIANGGIAIKPHLTRDHINERRVELRSPSEFRSMGINPRHLQLVQRGMDGVVNSERGTAYRARITEPGMSMAGKSGSAQVYRITEAERAAGVVRQDQQPWHRRDNALFIAFAPVDQPRYACGVVVEHGIGGSAVAAPICARILTEAQRRLRQRLPGAQRVADGRP
jgi:penicillin-binding protein 2